MAACSYLWQVGWQQVDMNNVGIAGDQQARCHHNMLPETFFIQMEISFFEKRKLGGYRTELR